MPKVQYDQLYKKYAQMAKTKTPFQVSDNILTPTMGEMIEEDLSYEALLQTSGDIDGSGNPTKPAFYLNGPYTDELGYDNDLSVLLADAKVHQERYNGKNIQWSWCKSDGDTLTFNVKDVDIGSKPIIIGNDKYNTFKEYFALGIPGGNVSDNASFNVRFVGINCAEIPHFDAKYTKKSLINKQVVKKTFKEIKDNPSYVYWRFPTNNKNDYDKKYNFRNDEEILYFIKASNTSSTYNEIVMNAGSSKSYAPKPTGKINHNENIDEVISKHYRLDNPDADTEPGFNANTDIAVLIVAKEDSKRESIGDAYRAQNAIKKQLEASKYQVRLMLDAKTRTVTNKVSSSGVALYSIFYSKEFCENMINQMLIDNSDLRLSGYSYKPYGTDMYGRYLSAVYSKTKDGRWINLNKLILASSKHTEAMPDYSGHPELNNKQISDAFELWTYDPNRFRWLDSFEELTQKSYEERIKLHERLTGHKFCHLRNNTVLIGDTLMIIPPTNIRNVTQTTYEKIPLLRSKGQLTKGGNHNESMIELTLYFAGDIGINGIPVDFDLPSGETTTYYMNGLRSLVAQFKLTPFLPIENEYINDVLNIEAVSLLNLEVNTIKEYPKMLQATLILRAFNYRMFMPDLPLGIEAGEISENALSRTNPIFSKAFQWDVFRYYYQRLLLEGERLHALEYNSPEYNEILYRGLTALQPAAFCNSNVSFYIPDIDWLDKALAKKKEEDEAIINFQAIELSDETREAAKNLTEDMKKLEEALKPTISNFYKGIGDDSNWNTLKIGPNYYYPVDIEYLNARTRLKITDNMTTNPILEYYAPLHDSLKTAMLETGLFSDIIGTESYKEVKDDATNVVDKKVLIWTIGAKINDFKKLSSKELSELREVVASNLGEENKEIVLKDNCIAINVMIFAHANNGDVFDIKLDTASFTKTLEALHQIGNRELTNFDKDIINDEELNYRDPAKMPFVPFIENALATDMAISLSNTFTETKLKSVDGISGQYVGGQDSTISLKIVTCDKLLVSSISALSDISFQFTNDYKRIMSCTPIRIKSEFTKLYGINEVSIDMIDINTIEEMPGAYEITMRLTSLDRTIRQREQLNKMNFVTNGGYVGEGHAGKISQKTYFDLENVLSEVEVYPDLELPRLYELRKAGYAYLRYTLSNDNRAYPDPDFYMVYTNSYSAAIMKAQIKDYYEKLLNADIDTKDLEQVVLNDTETQEEFIAKLDDIVGLHLIKQNKNADITDEACETISKNLKKYDEKISKSKKKHEKQTEKALKYLLASNTTDGWRLKPNWSAPLCSEETNDLIKMMPPANSGKKDYTDHSAAIKLKTTRRNIINAIDSLLAQPIDIPKNVKTDVPTLNKEIQEQKIYHSIKKAVKNVFKKNSYGEEIAKLLDPTKNKIVEGNDDSLFDLTIGTLNVSTQFKNPNLLGYIIGFTYAAACVASSESDYEERISNIDRLNGKWGPRMWLNECNAVSSYNSNSYIPLCRVGDANVGLPSSSADKKKQAEEEMLKNAIDNGSTFGPFGIRTYTLDEIKELTRPELNIRYVEKENYPLYKYGNGMKGGFLDPYYNALSDDNEELKRYKRGIMINAEIAAEAFLRNSLVWLRKLILDGLFISEIDIFANDVVSMINVNSEYIKKQLGGTEDTLTFSDMFKKLFDLFKTKEEKELEELTNTDELYIMAIALAQDIPRSACARMIYPIYMAITNGSPLIYNDMKIRNYDGLESAVNASLTSSSTSILSKDLKTFFTALKGIGMLKLGDLEKGWADLSQKISNAVSKEVYLEFANNPKIYTMHSFYDMLMNDKRGRLVRAFPTYYMILVDEGRRIGYWKLHDNFYNMSSISDIQIVKSRKMAADTASITMTNAYNSYATEHDNSTKYKYADLYGVRDVFDSIFSPKRYYDKANEIRQTSQIKDKVVLKPGIRMHIRMGYSADASRLPAMFNGRIAEVNTGDVVNIVAQGDGVELTNPLNCLGNIESNQIDTAQSLFFPSVFTNLRGSWSKGGLSPKNQLASILSAEYGGLEGIANYISNGQYFNTNPFGIVHFGDMRYTEVFDLGETVQNLYEVCDDDLLPDMNTLSKDPSAKKSTPIINTSLYDKTFWDLMHISARAGKDYIAAVRDFGFRSTIFLGQNNHYYAYGYKKVNGNIYEKRKPFQQYHYIEPYNDIIYNTIKASEKDIRTNAIGVWQANNLTFGRKTKTVGPMFLDINIYPEYQKSMTIDTGLLADGNGGFGINLFDAIGEGHVFAGKGGQEDKTLDDKVNVKLAERMTINALKESIKDMYQGEVTILGSPGIKPFDRVHIYDQQEDMTGDFEVETVIHSLNAYTGFTTTIHPDLIARMAENQQEIAGQHITKQLFGIFSSTVMLTTYRHFFSKINSKLIKGVMKSSPMAFTSATLAETITKTSLFTKNLDKLDSEIVQNISRHINNVVEGAEHNMNSVYMKSFKNLVDEIFNMSISETSNASDMIKYIKKLEDLNLDSFSKRLDSMIASSDKSDVKDILKLKKELLKSYDNMFKSIDLENVFLAINSDPNLSKALDKIDKDLFAHFKKQGFKMTSREDLKKFNKIFQSDEILNAIAEGTDDALQKAFKSSITPAIRFADKADDAVGGLRSIKKIMIKGGSLLDNMTLLIAGPAGFAAFLASFVIEMLISSIIGAAARSIFETWFDSLQTITIYPMKQYSKNFTAGINGAKACTYGAPPRDGWNSIQGMIIQGFESIERLNPIAKFFISGIVNEFVADPNRMKEMSDRYKTNLGITSSEKLSENDVIEKLYETVSKNMDTYGTSKHAVSIRPRVQNLDLKNEQVITSFNKYAIRNLRLEDITSNIKVSKLVALEYFQDIQSYITNGRLKIAHTHSKNSKIVNVNMNEKTYEVSTLPTFVSKDKNTWDKPNLAMIQKDASIVLKTILDETYAIETLADNKYEFHSGTVLNTNDWRSTGFNFVLKASKTKGVLQAFKNAEQKLNANKYKVFTYAKTATPGYYTFKIYPPK